MDIPEFVNREKEIREVKAILSGRPNFVYFVYGPINSGKTALIIRVAEELSKDYVIFYVNFRGRDVQTIDDLTKVLFRVKRGKISEETKEFVKEVLKSGAKVLYKLKGIPIPENMFDILFRSDDKVEDIFAYLEEYFGEIVEEGYKPVFILDEMQTIKEVINATGKPVIERLFNFFVRLTKETHLCHCLCATSDCLFIEDVYSNARLEGRAKYLLVDDLEKEEAYSVYEGFGFEDKELVWGYIGGKIGDMVSLFEEKKRGLSEKEALERMFKDTKNKLEWIKLMKLRKREDGNDLWKFLELFKKADFVSKNKIEEDFEKFLFWIEENVLFYNHVEGTVRLQSRLLWRVIREVMSSI